MLLKKILRNISTRLQMWFHIEHVSECDLSLSVLILVATQAHCKYVPLTIFLQISRNVPFHVNHCSFLLLHKLWFTAWEFWLRKVDFHTVSCTIWIVLWLQNYFTMLRDFQTDAFEQCCTCEVKSSGTNTVKLRFDKTTQTHVEGSSNIMGASMSYNITLVFF